MILRISEEEFHTVLAALRHYQASGPGDPANRSERIHDLATNGESVTSLDDGAIDQLCERINTEYED